MPREIEGKPFSNPPTDPLHPHIVQPRTKTGGHDAMSMHPQARSQTERPDPSGASRSGGAPLRRFAGTSLPNSKVGGNKRELSTIKHVSFKTVLMGTLIDWNISKSFVVLTVSNKSTDLVWSHFG